MSEEALFMAYALFFRLGIIVAGLVCIRLGYKLLQEDVGGQPLSTVEASLHGTRIRLQKIAPGSLMALFGAAIITVMLLQGNPENLHKLQNSITGTTETINTRGDGDPVITKLRDADSLFRKGDVIGAEKQFREVLATVSPALNGLAYIYSTNGRSKEALNLSLSAVELDPSNAHYLDTLADIDLKLGDRPNAIIVIGKAAQLDPEFNTKAQEIRGSGK